VDADLDLARTGRRDLDLLDAEDFGATDFVESHASRHVPLLLRAIRRRTFFRDCSGLGNSGGASRPMAGGSTPGWGMATIRDEMGRCLHDFLTITPPAGSPSRRNATSTANATASDGLSDSARKTGFFSVF
jgi:hypothetical protein